MILTKEQTLSFMQDDNTIANTNGIDYVESNIEQIDTDEAIYTLVVKVGDKFYRGQVQYYDAGGSFSERDFTYKPGFYENFKGLEMKEVKKVPKTIEVWEEV